MQIVSFKQNNHFASIPNLNEKYTTATSKAETIVIWGSSKETDSILKSMNLCSKTTKDLISQGYNILTGCGSNGIMGSAYKSAAKYSNKDIKTQKPTQNLAIVVEPAWGDEDINNCIAIGKAQSETDRIEKFRKTADTFVIFPGSATTIQEAATIIQKNEYSSGDEPLKKIILVGKDFFSGLNEQYQKLFEYKLLKHSPKDLFTIADTEEEILEIVNSTH